MVATTRRPRPWRRAPHPLTLTLALTLTPTPTPTLPLTRYGPVAELACVESASLRYDVKDSALKLKCEIAYVKAPVATADE